MNVVKRVLDAVTSAFGVVAGLLVTLMMIHITADVIGRAFFNHPLTGTIAFVSNYYMVFVVCLPLAFVERAGQHISVEVLTDTFSAKVQHHLFSWTLLLSAVVFAFVAWASWGEAVDKYRLGNFVIEENTVIPIWPGFFAVPLGFGLGALYLLLKFILYLMKPQAPAATAEASEEPIEVFHD